MIGIQSPVAIFTAVTASQRRRLLTIARPRPASSCVDVVQRQRWRCSAMAMAMAVRQAVAMELLSHLDLFLPDLDLLSDRNRRSGGGGCPVRPATEGSGVSGCFFATAAHFW
nr:hypothetical protein Iba_scaffold32688CG0010 [Ipomoea batatas]GMD41198.1 hypothetical protein Iba_chr10aCG16740 [Ipomoea batatas]